ncbi:MAG: DNA polymerase III subunit delta [Deltaproteobacteria bacterium]|nr:DNA polymerase III subunit delta [Deltaproteobacteria bacterium]
MPNSSSLTPRELEKELQKDIVRPFYYFYGEEKLGLNNALEAIRRVLFGRETSRQRSEIILYGKEVLADELLMAAQTLPMMARRQMITIKAAHEMSRREMRRLVPYLDAPADFTCLVFTADTVDRKSDFFNAMERHNALVAFRPLPEKELPRWVQDQARLVGKELSRDAAFALVELAGTQMETLKGELEKLLLYAEDRKVISAADIRKVAIDSRSFSVFELVDALGNKDVEKSLRILGKLLETGGPDEHLKVLGMIVRQIRLIWQVKQLKTKGKSQAVIQKDLGLASWLVEKFHRFGRHFSEEDLLCAVRMLAHTDLELKSSRLSSRPIMEGLILSLCKKGG